MKVVLVCNEAGSDMCGYDTRIFYIYVRCRVVASYIHVLDRAGDTPYFNLKTILVKEMPAFKA